MVFAALLSLLYDFFNKSVRFYFLFLIGREKNCKILVASFTDPSVTNNSIVHQMGVQLSQILLTTKESILEYKDWENPEN